MVPSNVFVAYLLTVLVWQCNALPTKTQTDVQFELDRMRNMLDIMTKLDNKLQDKQNIMNNGANEIEMKSDEDDSNIEDLKKHWLSLLGLQHEPAGTVSPVGVPAFMKAVYALYDSDSATDALYHHAGIAEEEDRTIRALMPQRGRISCQLLPKCAAKLNN